MTADGLKKTNHAVYAPGETTSIAAVAVPTSAMEEGGTEYRLILAVGSVLVAIASPAVFFLFNATRHDQHNDAVRAACSLLGFALLYGPLFGFSRYSFGVPTALFMTCRAVLLPLVFAVSGWGGLFWPVCVCGYACELLLFLLRRACRNPQPPATDGGKLRILLISDAMPPKVDGVATFAQHMIRLLPQLYGHELAVITSIPGAEELFGVPITRLPGMTTKISPGHHITFPLLPGLVRVLLAFRPDVVHLFEVSPMNLATFYFCHLLDMPCTFSHHTRLDLYINIVTPLLPTRVNEQLLKTLEWAFFPLPDGHLCVSKVLFRKVTNRGASEPRAWSSGVDEKFSRAKFSAEKRTLLSGGQPDLPLVLHVGRLGPEKNSDEIPAILRETWREMQGQVRFAVVGDGILRESIESEVKQLGDVRCEFTGILRGLELETCYASGDVFFSPSTTEGFPLVFLEAMRSGLAVVGPVAGGVPDAYTAGCEGELYAPHDARAAAQAIKRAILAGRDMRDRAEAAGLAYSWDRVCGELEDLLQLVVRKRQQSGWQGWWNSSHAVKEKKKD